MTVHNHNLHHKKNKENKRVTAVSKMKNLINISDHFVRSHTNTMSK